MNDNLESITSPKTMILIREEDFETWMAAPWPEAARLQRPLPDGALQVVARGEKKDEAVQAGEQAAPQSGQVPSTS
jgi:putative SOS response-associated peptidase YedK